MYRPKFARLAATGQYDACACLNSFKLYISRNVMLCRKRWVFGMLPWSTGTCRNRGGAAAQPRCGHQSPLKHRSAPSPSSARPLASGLASHAAALMCTRVSSMHACFPPHGLRASCQPARAVAPVDSGLTCRLKNVLFPAGRLLYARPSAGHASVGNWLHLAL